MAKRLTETNIQEFEKRFGPVPKVVSRLIRPALIAGAGKTLSWSDWSAIEARTLPWLAATPGAEAVLDVFRENDADPDLPDIYKVEAAGIYDINATQVDKNERQVGKVAILALGFGGGVGALDAMAAGYGLYLEPAFKKFIVDRWRANNPWAVTFWSDLMEAFTNAFNNPGTAYAVGRVAYIFNPDYLGGTMFCYLPDGRPLTYANLHWENVKVEDENGDEEIVRRLRYQKGYERGYIWHGILAENITQAAAASLLRTAMVNIEKDRSFPGELVAHTHDELVAESYQDDEEACAAALKEHMEHRSSWAEGLPLVAETASNWYYTKTID